MNSTGDEWTAAGRLIGCLGAGGAAPVTQLAEGLHGPSIAVFSHDYTYRYLLTRRWEPGPVMTWVMLNPSTADAGTDDATIARCWRRAAADRFGSIAVVNLFALVATDPAALRTHPDPAGPGNDAALRAFCQPGDTVVAAWGALTGLRQGRSRAAAVTWALAEARVSPLCLGTTKGGQPKHPGRLAYSIPLVPWSQHD